MAAPSRYGCSSCKAIIEPEFCWEMESWGEGNRNVLITYHCHCTAHDGFRYGCYPADTDAILHLLGNTARSVVTTVNGDWRWENPVKLRSVAPMEWPMNGFRKRLENIHTVADFIHACEKDDYGEGGDEFPSWL